MDEEWPSKLIMLMKTVLWMICTWQSSQMKNFVPCKSYKSSNCHAKLSAKKTRRPTNVGLTFGIAVWVWTLLLLFLETIIVTQHQMENIQKWNGKPARLFLQNTKHSVQNAWNWKCKQNILRSAKLKYLENKKW